LGASGMVMGALGMISVQSLFRWGGVGKPIKPAIAGFLAGLMLFVLWSGFDPRSDVIAHVGGFIGGALLGTLLCLVPEKYLRHDLANFLSGILVAGLVLLTWGLALR
jgi:membrane associated rhomboid family serine protease